MANKPEQSEAHDYLRSILDRYDDTRPPDAVSIAKMRQLFFKLLDSELASATTSARKKQLKALGAGGTHAFDMIAGMRSRTVSETFKDLVDIATGVRNRDGLAPETPRTKQRTADQDWQIAAAIVAIQNMSSVAPELEKRILSNTGMTAKQIKKILDNLDQGKGSYEGIKTNIRDIETRKSNGDTWMLDDFFL